MKFNPIAFVLLYPFSLLYGFVLHLRNIFYDIGILKATSFNLPVINVGNLSLGGSGKTPHIEFLVELLSPYLNVATLSRGYKRKTKGFRIINLNDDAASAGDEPLQFKRKFPTLPVAVSESRNIGIPLLVQKFPSLQVVLLDDAFQHRSVIPGLNILVSPFNEPFYEDYLLPLGRLREPRSAYNRADIIIISKCPQDLKAEDRTKIIKKLNPFQFQKIFFSYYEYGNPYFFIDKNITISLDQSTSVILISAIAKVDYLLEYLYDNSEVENIVKFEDHHYFNDLELEQFRKIYENVENENTIFLTTEKDAMRLELHKEFILKHNIPIFVLPIKTKFLHEDESVFSQTIKEYLLAFKA